MKRLGPTAGCVLAFALILHSTSAHADAGGAQGVYRTAEDFTGGRLTRESSCKSPDHKIELHDILNKPYVHVTQRPGTSASVACRGALKCPKRAQESGSLTLNVVPEPGLLETSIEP